MTTDPETVAGTGDATRGRDAAATRRLLLEAARRRFADEGYTATTSRDIAGDVGVNVALINRYFSSKEGLFEACLQRTVEELDRPEDRVVGVDDLVRGFISRIIGAAESPEPLQTLLLLRSSGDDRVDEIRRRTMQSYTERLAAIAGWRAADPGTAHLLLRAQVAMAMGFGILLMRKSADLEPLASASADDLADPLREVLGALLGAPSEDVLVD